MLDSDLFTFVIGAGLFRYSPRCPHRFCCFSTFIIRSEPPRLRLFSLSSERELITLAKEGSIQELPKYLIVIHVPQLSCVQGLRIFQFFFIITRQSCSILSRVF